jgi:hypothetical protein
MRAHYFRVHFPNLGLRGLLDRDYSWFEQPMFGPITASLWTTNFVVLVAVLYLLLRRRLWHELPVFVGLIAASVLFSGILQVLAGLDWRWSYYYGSWASRAVQGLLGLAVIHEVLRKILFHFAALRNLAQTAFWVAIIVLLGAAVLSEATLSDQGWPHALTRAMAGLERALLLLSAGLMMVVFALVAMCGMAWRRLVFGVAFGLGIYSAVKLALVTVYSYLGIDWYAWYTLALMGNGILQASLWLAYIAIPERQPDTVPMVVHYTLERWNNALQEVLQR